jgi:hypothetical protein
MRGNSPPALACWIFESIMPASSRESVVGDLIEEFPLRAKSTSAVNASRWFWSQCCRSALFMAWTSLRGGSWLVSLSIAVGVYLAMGAAKVGADLIISRMVAPAPATYVVLAPIVFLMATAIGGCIAARIRRGATVFLAFLVMITVAALIDIKTCTIPVPWWYQFGFLILGPLTVLITPAVFSSPRPKTEPQSAA